VNKTVSQWRSQGGGGRGATAISTSVVNANLRLLHAFSGLFHAQKCVCAGAPSRTPPGSFHRSRRPLAVGEGARCPSQEPFTRSQLSAFFGPSGLRPPLSTPISGYAYAARISGLHAVAQIYEVKISGIVAVFVHMNGINRR